MGTPHHAMLHKRLTMRRSEYLSVHPLGPSGVLYFTIQVHRTAISVTLASGEYLGMTTNIMINMETVVLNMRLLSFDC